MEKVLHLKIWINLKVSENLEVCYDSWKSFENTVSR